MTQLVVSVDGKSVDVNSVDTRGVWGYAPPGKFLRVDAKILQFRGISI